jgi:DNA invertase Pin-like site-specific DNA recombinase
MKMVDNNKTYNVGIYCRLSKDDGDSKDQSASIGTQKDMLIKYVQEKGWNLTRIYAEILTLSLIQCG